MNGYGLKYNIDTITKLNGGSAPVVWDDWYFIAPWGDDNVDGVSSFNINGETKVWQSNDITLDTFHPKSTPELFISFIDAQVYATGTYNIETAVTHGGNDHTYINGDGVTIVRGANPVTVTGEHNINNIVLEGYSLQMANASEVKAFTEVFAKGSELFVTNFFNDPVDNIIKNCVYKDHSGNSRTKFFKGTTIIDSDFTTLQTEVARVLENSYEKNSNVNYGANLTRTGSNSDDSLGAPDFNSELLNDYTVKVHTPHWRQGTSNKNISNAKLGISNFTTYAQTIDNTVAAVTWTPITI